MSQKICCTKTQLIKISLLSWGLYLEEKVWGIERGSTHIYPLGLWCKEKLRWTKRRNVKRYLRVRGREEEITMTGNEEGRYQRGDGRRTITTDSEWRSRRLSCILHPLLPSVLCWWPSGGPVLGATCYYAFIIPSFQITPYFNYLLRLHMEHDEAAPLCCCHDTLSFLCFIWCQLRIWKAIGPPVWWMLLPLSNEVRAALKHHDATLDDPYANASSWTPVLPFPSHPSFFIARPLFSSPFIPFKAIPSSTQTWPPPWFYVFF